MTDRIKGFVVTLAPDIREDDAEPIAEAIRLLKGVISVDAKVAEIDHHFAVKQAKREMQQRLHDVIWKDD